MTIKAFRIGAIALADAHKENVIAVTLARAVVVLGLVVHGGPLGWVLLFAVLLAPIMAYSWIPFLGLSDAQSGRLVSCVYPLSTGHHPPLVGSMMVVGGGWDI